MKCVVCEKEAKEDQFCVYHALAKRAIIDCFAKWKEAYDAISWEEYLDRIKRRHETGQWAKEVAEILGREHK